jgi:hypothetical protein
MIYSSIKIDLPPLMVAIALCGSALPAVAYPEFQAFAEKKSGRAVDCAMCHVNEHGPVGDEDGQIGRLSPEELQSLNEARGAMEPGTNVTNPILNEFGNALVKSIGMKKVLEAKSAPEKLPQFLGNSQDTDHDGIPDGTEFLNGTDPANPFHGDPWKLLVNNLAKYKGQVALACAAVFLLDFGFVNLIKALGELSSAAAIKRSARSKAESD